MNTSQRAWYYAEGDKELGPISEEEIRELLRDGQVSGGTLVWTDSLKDWIFLEDSILAPRKFAKRPSKTQDASIQSAPDLMVEDVPTALALGFLTCGLYGMLPFYRVGKSYDQATKNERFESLFWVYFATTIGFAIAFFPVVWVTIPSVGGFLLHRVLSDRDAISEYCRLKEPLTDRNTHVVLWVAGWLLLPAAGFGLILIVMQALLFFHDHNRLAAVAKRTDQASRA